MKVSAFTDFLWDELCKLLQIQFAIRNKKSAQIGTVFKWIDSYGTLGWILAIAIKICKYAMLCV